MAAQAVRWAYSARADLLEAIKHVAEASPSGAQSLLEQIETAAAGLAQFPNRGARVKELDFPNLRQVFVGSYRLVYQVEEGGVGIVRLIHGRRDFLKAWKERPT